jgi:hypothetical protein
MTNTESALYSSHSHTIAFDQLMPVFLSTPESHESQSLPFKFVGGFGLPTKSIGFIMSVQGVYSMIAQIFLFPFVVRRFGALGTFRFAVISYPLLNFLVPYLVLLPLRLRMAGVWVCLLWKITAAVLSYPSNAILLANSAPSMLVLGTINGIAASTASLSRSFGPTVSGLIHSAGLEMGYSGLAWWSSACICILGAVESMWIKEVDGRLDIEEEIDEEAAFVTDLDLNQGAIEVAIAAAQVTIDEVEDEDAPAYDALRSKRDSFVENSHSTACIESTSEVVCRQPQ